MIVIINRIKMSMIPAINMYQIIKMKQRVRIFPLIKAYLIRSNYVIALMYKHKDTNKLKK